MQFTDLYFQTVLETAENNKNANAKQLANTVCIVGIFCGCFTAQSSVGYMQILRPFEPLSATESKHRPSSITFKGSSYHSIKKPSLFPLPWIIEKAKCYAASKFLLSPQTRTFQFKTILLKYLYHEKTTEMNVTQI